MRAAILDRDGRALFRLVKQDLPGYRVTIAPEEVLLTLSEHAVTHQH